MVAAVRTRRAFDALRRSRSRGRSGPIWVVRADAPDDDRGARVAYAVGRSVGGAVVRNRIRRRLRALVDALDRHGQLRPGLYLIGAGPVAAQAPYAELDRHLRRALAGT